MVHSKLFYVFYRNITCMTLNKQQARAYSNFTTVSNVCLFEFFVFNQEN